MSAFYSRLSLPSAPALIKAADRGSAALISGHTLAGYVYSVSDLLDSGNLYDTLKPGFAFLGPLRHSNTNTLAE